MPNPVVSTHLDALYAAASSATIVSNAIGSLSSAEPNGATRTYVVMGVGRSTDPSNNRTASSASGWGLTWTEEIEEPLPVEGARFTLAVYRATGIPSSGAVTMTFSGNQQARMLHIVELDSVDAAATDGVVQSDGNNSTANVTALNATLAAFGSVDNATVGFCWIRRDGNIVPEAGYTELDELQSGGDANTTDVFWRNDNDLTPGATFGSAKCIVVGLEIKATSASLTAATISAGVGLDDQNVPIAVASEDTGADEHELHRSTTSGFTPGVGTLIQDAIAADITAQLVDNAANSTSAPSPDTQYHYKLVSKLAGESDVTSNQLTLKTAPARPTNVQVT